ITNIDVQVARILGLPMEMADAAKALSKTMMERRLARAEEAKPGAIRGEEAVGVERPRKTGKQKKETLREKHVTLDKFIKE
ncbi:MAG: hypothetical protein QXL49_02145, partial [Acidilobaceae archaeon]